MWMREIHNRLADGSYDNEFDFAWDVRLVFANCLGYNSPDSAIFHAAQSLSTDFEHLLCNWVYNVHDVSVDDLATGPWDDWQYLKVTYNTTLYRNIPSIPIYHSDLCTILTLHYHTISYRTEP